MPADNTAVSLLAVLEAEQERLRAVLVGRDEAKLARRPPNGNWSVLENVRHLLFVEQGLLHRYVAAALEWSSLGLTPEGLRGREPFSVVGTASPANVGEVLAAWGVAHAAAAALAERDTEEVRIALGRHIRHLRQHILIIERQIRRTGA